MPRLRSHGGPTMMPRTHEEFMRLYPHYGSEEFADALEALIRNAKRSARTWRYRSADEPGYKGRSAVEMEHLWITLGRKLRKAQRVHDALREGVEP
jgi:hypothetical protein